MQKHILMFKINHHQVENVLLKKLKKRIINIPENEDICYITYSYTKFDFVMAIMSIMMFPPLISILLIELINITYLKWEIILPIIIPEIMFLPIFFWKPFLNKIKFSLLILTNKALYKILIDKSIDMPLILRYPYTEINYISFSNPYTKKSKKKNKGTLVISAIGHISKIAFENLKDITLLRKFILSEMYQNNPPLNRYNEYLNNYMKVPHEFEDIPLSFSISKEILDRIEKKKVKYRKYGPILFGSIIILVLIIIIPFILNPHWMMGGIFALMVVCIYAGLLIPVFILLVYSDYKKLNRFQNSDSDPVNIHDNQIEFINKNTRLPQIIPFTKDLIFNLLGTVRAAANPLEFDIDTICIDYLGFSNNKPLYLGKLEKLNEFYFILEQKYHEWLNNNNFFLTFDQIKQKFLEDNQFNNVILEMINKNIQFSREESKQQLDSSRDKSQVRMKYPVQKITHFFNENEEVEYVFHIQSGKSALLKPGLILSGIGLGLLLFFTIKGILSGEFEHMTMGFIYTILGGIFGVIFGFFYVLWLIGALILYLSYKNQEIVLTNQKIYIVQKNRINVILYSNILEVACIKLRKRSNEYGNVDINLKYQIETLQSMSFFKIKLGFVKKDNPIFSILISKGIPIQKDN